MANILIIDDDLDFCHSLQRVFDRWGHEISYSLNLQDGINSARENPYDFIFLDVALPDGDGLQSLSAFKKLSSAPEVVILTGAGNSEGAVQAISQGAWDYLEKPVSLDSLKLLLTRAIKHRKIKTETNDQAQIDTSLIIGESKKIQRSLDVLAKAAMSRSDVIISGETGTGKELFAKALHDSSPYTKGEMVVIDCTNLPKGLVESLLFGHTKGAFTGAHESKEGLFKLADGGTVFLDEIGELSLSLQKSLLRVLQERSFRPVGGKKEIKSNFRVVAATNRDLGKMVEEGKFRKDLYFRLKVLHVDLPPLREREDDIELLANHYIEKLCHDYGIETKILSNDYLEALKTYNWPGNVRELVNVIYASVDNAFDELELYPNHLPLEIRAYIAKTSFSSKEEKPETQDNPGTANPKTSENPGRVLDYAGFDGLPSYKRMRNLVVSKMEADYLKRLAMESDGEIKKACSISKLSRARLYELLKKHNLSIK